MSRDANDFAEHLRPARRCFSILSIALLAFLTLSFAPAAAQVVALGASNTEGRGVAGSAAWPAQLERMLRAKGYNVQVKNAGVSGDDTRRMLGRLNSTVPEGTRVVILEKASTNDSRRNIDTAANIAEITHILSARKIKVILIPGMHGWASRQLQVDGVHINEAGHIAVAQKLLPRVSAALGKR
jgi:acyl-CoA thioesterase-1